MSECAHMADTFPAASELCPLTGVLVLALPWRLCHSPTENRPHFCLLTRGCCNLVPSNPCALALLSKGGCIENEIMSPSPQKRWQRWPTCGVFSLLKRSDLSYSETFHSRQVK